MPTEGQGIAHLRSVNKLLVERDEARAEVEEWKQAAGAEADLANGLQAEVERLREQVRAVQQECSRRDFITQGGAQPSKGKFNIKSSGEAWYRKTDEQASGPDVQLHQPPSEET